MKPDNAFAKLRDANPAPVRPIDDRPTATEMLRVAQGAELRAGHTDRRRPVLVTSMTFALVMLVVGAVAFLTLAGDDSSAPPSTSAPPSIDSTVPSTTEALRPTTTVSTSAFTAEYQRVLDEFAARYSEGDVDGVLAMIAPGVVKTTVRDEDPAISWDPALLRHQLLMDAALDTSLDLVSCQALQSGSVSCLARRENDLTRIAGVGPQDDRVTLRVADGFVTVWQDRQGFHATPYQQLAVAPFTAWLAEAHPETPDPHPLIGGVSRWRPDRSIVERIPALISEYAESRGEAVGD